MEKQQESLTTVQTLTERIGLGYLIVTTGGLAGYLPVAPGTAGTLVAIPIYLVLVESGWLAYALTVAVLFALGVLGANKIEAATQKKDNRIIVIDEIVGYLVTMFYLPQHWGAILLGFFVARAFDIWKPYPIRRIDEHPTLKGFGVMADDLLAGVYGCIVMQIVVRLAA